jgi:hypothetical protein
MAIADSCSIAWWMVEESRVGGVEEAGHVRLGVAWRCLDCCRTQASLDADPRSFHRNTITQANQRCNLVSHDGAQKSKLVDGVLLASGRRYRDFCQEGSAVRHTPAHRSRADPLGVAHSSHDCFVPLRDLVATSEYSHVVHRLGRCRIEQHSFSFIKDRRQSIGASKVSTKPRTTTLPAGIRNAIGRTGMRHTSHSPATLNAKHTIALSKVWPRA